MVETSITPPGRTSAAHWPRKARTSGTCSMTSRQSTASKTARSAIRSSTRPARYVMARPCACSVPARRLDVLRRGVESRHGGAEAASGSHIEPAAAADVEDRATFQALQVLRRQVKMLRQPLQNEAQPRRPDRVQRAELAVGIPPLRCDLGEALDLGGIERALAAGAGGCAHAGIGGGGSRVVKRAAGASGIPGGAEEERRRPKKNLSPLLAARACWCTPCRDGL